MGDLAIVIGMGEIGTALANVLDRSHDVIRLDKHDPTAHDRGLADFLHICFPYSPEFRSEVLRYQGAYTPQYTVIHSTVEPGTSSYLDAAHSPCLGIHPNLEQSMLTFEKFVGGYGAGPVARHLMAAGMKVRLFDLSETTELVKILSTTFYGLCIEWTKHVACLCAEEGVPFEAWTLWTQNYNSGYETLGRPEYRRPNLQPIPGPIGGHCVLPNLDLLGPGDPFTEFIRRRNE